MPRPTAAGIHRGGDDVDAVGEPFFIENADGRAPVVILVDHASNRFPAPWGDLGLDAAAREAHIAWDPGALPVAREMSRLLDAPLVGGTVSRLVLDLNRPHGSATLIPEVSETTEIPGNRALDPADRARRIAEVYEPYHAAVDDMIARQEARAGSPLAVVAVHTFTPVYKGRRRDLHVGILFDADERLGRPLLRHLQAEPGLRAEENQPYSPADEVYWTLDRHAVSRGHMNVMIEVRNDLLRDAKDQKRWADRLAAGISASLAQAGLGRSVADR